MITLKVITDIQYNDNKNNKQKNGIIKIVPFAGGFNDIINSKKKIIIFICLSAMMNYIFVFFFFSHKAIRFIKFLVFIVL